MVVRCFTRTSSGDLFGTQHECSAKGDKKVRHGYKHPIAQGPLCRDHQRRSKNLERSHGGQLVHTKSARSQRDDRGRR